jgi:23S rRNA pseudouridine1911/1915/1917 synthase
MTKRWSISPNPNVPFEVRYEDDDLLVVEKPSGVVSEPGRGHASDSLLNGLFAGYAARLQNLGEQRDWGLLHRLDRDTSGLLLVGLRNRAYDGLRKAFEERRVKKTYWALVDGTPKTKQGVIQSPIREVHGRQKTAVIHRAGRPAVTAYRVLSVSGPICLIEAQPKTGRLHQIRVHLASLGCPVLGDELYGRPTLLAVRVPRLCLHAAALSFVHPTTNRRIEVRSEWPLKLRTVLIRLGLPEP